MSTDAAGRARWGQACGDESGNAIVEFVYLAVLLMVPLVYILLAAFRVQSAAYAASGAAREAGRVFVTTADGEDPQQRAEVAASLVMSDSGLTLREDQLSITCTATPCLSPGARVQVRVHYVVALPFLPAVLTGGSGPASIPVSSRHLELVDPFRAAR